MSRNIEQLYSRGVFWLEIEQSYSREVIWLEI